MSPYAVIATCAGDLRLLGAATPINARLERGRLARALDAGRSATPQWMYSTHDVGPIRRRLSALALGADPASALARARVEELLCECDLLESIGRPKLGRLALQRFGPRGDVDPRDTLALAHAFISRAPERDAEKTTRTDALVPGSLLFEMRAAVRALGLPFEVTSSASLSALAATGPSSILVAADREITPRVTRRTVLHEVLGHAVPRARAREMPHPIFSVGTAGGHDDQEGWALLVEERAGMLDDERRFDLGARHLATVAMRDGATFIDVARQLRALGMSTERAILFAERAFRGSPGAAAGLGREAVYLEAFLRVKRHLAEHPGDEPLISSGQVAIASIPALRHFGKQP